jgi:hypothetical protein
MTWERTILELIVNDIIRNTAIAIVLIVSGIILGQVVKFILNRIVKRAEFSASHKSFISLFITIVKWSIYILFLNFALVQLGIPQFTVWLTSILMVIPAIVGALVLIGVGFSVSSYLKEIIEESRVSGWQILSEILFIFVNYIFIIFALKTALLSLDQTIVNYLLLILTAAVAFGFALWYSRKRR